MSYNEPVQNVQEEWTAVSDAGCWLVLGNWWRRTGARHHNGGNVQQVVTDVLIIQQMSLNLT